MRLFAMLQGGFYNRLIVEITDPANDLTKNSFIVGEGKMAETYVLASMRKKDRVSFVDADTNKLRTVRALRAHFVGKPT